MDEILYNSLSSYYHALSLKGYMPYIDAQKLLILSFYRDFILNDYRGLLSGEDYHTIESALNCLWGSSCLIPYPDYLKMGKLHLGEITEMAHRLKTVEEEPVLKLAKELSDVDNPDSQSDVMIMADED
jgi:hypothetical protein